MPHSSLAIPFAALTFTAMAAGALADDTGALGSQGVSDAEAHAIRGVITSQTEDLINGDTSGYASRWAESAVLMPPDHAPIAGREKIVAYVTEHFPSGTRLEFGNWDVAARNDLAVVTVESSVSVDVGPGGTELLSQMIVLRRQADGRWLVQTAIWGEGG